MASFGSSRELADRGGDAARDLVLALLRMALEDLDVDERHGFLPVVVLNVNPAATARAVRRAARIVAQLGGRPGKAHRAFLQHVDPVGERQREVHALLGEQDGEALALEPPICSSRCSTTSGARPSDGSSSSSSSGLPISVRPIVSICCSPPDRNPPCRSRQLAQLREEIEHALDGPRARPRPAAAPATSRFSHTVRSAKIAAVLRHEADAARARSGRAASR